MATIRSITLKNFKGIGEVTLAFGKKGAPPVNTLIGLNESGKTTILEGLSHFVTGDSAVSGLFAETRSKADIAALIPVNRKANFTGQVSITAVINLDDDDYAAAAAILDKNGIELERDSFVGDSEVSRIYNFDDGDYKGYKNSWDFSFKVRKKGSKSQIYKYYQRPKDSEQPDFWFQVMKAIQLRLPRVAYFPTFLVDMPKKIYLAEHPGEHAVNKYYRLVFQDILDSLGEGLSLEKHVVNRIEDFRKNNASSNWWSALWGDPTKSQIDSVFSKVSAAVTREVLGSWQKVFQRKIAAKNILVEWAVDEEEENLPYATFSIFDGESRYYVSERSLGFRWFFSFLLFTAFKQKAKRPTLFVFDEPAANLHAKAQAELLKSFSRTVSGGDGIVYSTHSHHMINPHWISGAYIVENTALDYDSDEDTFGLNAKPTNIIATPYRNFVAQYPGRTSYFQPVIDMLEYITPPIVGSPPFVLVEGITDFYALSLAARLGGNKLPFSVMPGVGAGSVGPQISLLMGRGERFVVLLDDDAAGRKEAQRYRSDWYLNEDQVFTIAKLGKSYEGKRLEELISIDTRAIISKYAQLTSKPNKKQIGLYLAEMCASNAEAGVLSEQTLADLTKLLELIGNHSFKD